MKKTLRGPWDSFGTSLDSEPTAVPRKFVADMNLLNPS
jgi:hypothetical protein